MIKAIIRFSVQNKLIIGLLVLALVVGGVVALKQLPIDAVPDITNNQVQVVTVSSALAPQEVEQFITYPVEVAMANIPNVIEIRSISRFGLSVVTIVFKDHVPILEARQFVKEQIGIAEAEIPEGLGQPELMPITTGLGEIYQYVLQVQPGYEEEFDAMELRTIQDWIVKRQLTGIPGIIEVSSFGGYLKQYEVALNPVLLQSYDVSLREVFDALALNNQNSGGSYIEKSANAYYIRTEGLIKTFEDINDIVIKNRNGIPVLIRHVGRVKFGSPKRFGAMTMDGKGEAVGGITLMLKGGNSSEAIANVHNRIEEVRASLPEGIDIYSYLDRSVLVQKTTHTVRNNLLEGGLIVFFVLLLLLGNLRAGFIVASIIPLAMLFAIIMMNYLGISANLMSLGAIDFGIVVDGAVIVVEGVLHTLFSLYVGKRLTQNQLDEVITESSAKLFRSAVFGVFIILVVFIPVMTLTGIEGKMFRPMAYTFSLVVLGALILSLTYVPMMSALLLPKNIKERRSLADMIINGLRKVYRPLLQGALKFPAMVISFSLAILIATFFLFRSLGAEFIPTLEEGDLAMQMTIQPGSALQESIRSSTKAEKVLLDNFPEIKHVVSKIGTAEVPTDPMAVEDADIMIILKEKSEWTSAKTREELVEKMKASLEVILGASFEFTQPIQLRFNELMTGAKTDIAVKIFGENTDTLARWADKAAALIESIPGAADVKAEQTEGLSQLQVVFDRHRIAEYGLNIEDLNRIVRTAYAGEVAGSVFENERKFDLVVRLDEPYRDELDLNRLFIHLPNGNSIPLSEVAHSAYKEGPMQISREGTRRRITIGINVRNRDIASLVSDIESTLNDQLSLPPGYYIRYGGQFENLEAARKRLGVAVPVALALIFILLYFTFGKLKYAIMIFSAVPMAAIGGVIALWVRGLPFSISAGIGFIALFGVAVLNGIVLISYFNRLRYEEGMTDVREIVVEGSMVRLRPVILTAAVAALGFLPMALSTTNGAEVQKPLATVVIGGLITATLLTLLLLPVLYYLVNKNSGRKSGKNAFATLVISLLLSTAAFTQTQPLSMETAIEHALQHHPQLQEKQLQIQAAQWEAEGARYIPPIEFSLGGGQFNTKLFDYNFSVTQSLGNPAADRQRKTLAITKQALRASEWALLQHQITHEVKQIWMEWAYYTHQEKILEQQENIYQEMLEKATRQYELGETSRLEETLVERQLTEVQRKRAASSRAIQGNHYKILQTTFLEGAFEPAIDSTLRRLPDPNNVLLDSLLTAPYKEDVEVALAQRKVAEKQSAPEWSFGYFNQSIRPDYSLQGVTIGMGIPIWKKSYQAQVEKAKIDELIAANRRTLNQFQLGQSLQAASVALASLRNELDNYGQLQLQQANTIRQLAYAQWQNGEIDYFKYLQSMSMAFEAELTYLELLHAYNQAVIQMDYLSQ